MLNLFRGRYLQGSALPSFPRASWRSPGQVLCRRGGACKMHRVDETFQIATATAPARSRCRYPETAILDPMVGIRLRRAIERFLISCRALRCGVITLCHSTIQPHHPVFRKLGRVRQQINKHLLCPQKIALYFDAAVTGSFFQTITSRSKLRRNENDGFSNGIA